MSFLNPLFLFGLAAAAIPVIIHLFTRRRPKDIPFPSLEFLAEVNQSEIRRLKLKQWLLLLLRALAVAALALAMSRPALKGSAGLKGGAATSASAKKEGVPQAQGRELVIYLSFRKVTPEADKKPEPKKKSVAKAKAEPKKKSSASSSSSKKSLVKKKK